MSTDIVNKVKPYTDNVRTRYHGKDVRHSVADSIDAIAAVVRDAVNNQIVDYDAFITSPRLSESEQSVDGKFKVNPGGFKDNGDVVLSENRCVTGPIKLERSTLICLLNNLDDLYRISAIWTYYNGTAVEKLFGADDPPLTKEDSLLAKKLSDRNQIRISFKKKETDKEPPTYEAAINGDDITAIENRLSLFVLTDKELKTENAPADAGKVGELIYGSRDRDKNIPRVLAWYKMAVNIVDGVVDVGDFSLYDLPDWSITGVTGKVWKAVFNNTSEIDSTSYFPYIKELNDSSSYIMTKEQYGVSSPYYAYILSSLNKRAVWVGYTLAGGTSITWLKTSPSISQVKILVLGNSYSYSTLGLLPAILKEFGVTIKLGILYDSGFTVEQHEQYFDNDTKHSMFSVGNGATWTNIASSISNPAAGYTTKEALDYDKWDYIVFQTSVSAQVAHVESLADKIASYIEYPISFLLNMPHSRGPNDDQFSQISDKNEASDKAFLRGAAIAQALVEGGTFTYKDVATDDTLTVTSTGNTILAALPSGTAVQNARHVQNFKTIGLKSYLCYDGISHLQNGIATLIPSYAAALKIMELIGEKQKINNIQLFPTTEWINASLLLTRQNNGGYSHGYSQGLIYGGGNNDKVVENFLLAQKCALQAYKHPYQITDITGNSPAITNPPSEEFSKMVRDVCAYRVHVALNNNVATMQESFDDIVAAHEAGKLIEIEVNIGIAKVHGILNAESIQDQTGVINGLIFSVVLDLATASGEAEATPQLMQIVIKSDSVTASQLNLETA